jgi:hypothetical protein
MISQIIFKKRTTMLANTPDDRLAAESKPSMVKIEAGVDPSWKTLYKAGGISAILYIVLALVIPGIQVLTMSYFQSTAEYSGLEFLQYIAENRTWWLIMQTTVLGTSILAIVAFVALYAALENFDKSLSALGAVVSVTCHILFLAYYPVLLGLVYLSDKYVAASASQQVLLGTTADSLIAINNAFNPLYEPLFALGILFFSLAMLKGLFHKSIAYIGVVTCIAAFVFIALWPVLNLAYFLWWVPFIVWFAAVGWKLYRLSKI